MKLLNRFWDSAMQGNTRKKTGSPLVDGDFLDTSITGDSQSVLALF